MKLVKKLYTELRLKEKQRLIKLIKDKFELELSKELSLDRVSAPLVVTKDSGLQDDLSGVERTVSFDVLKDGRDLEIVQSLAKWKRQALKKYDYKAGEGLYTDMTAIRRDDKMDETHSIYVDQWDWEKVILSCDRTEAYLQDTVRKIVKAISTTSKMIKQQTPAGVEMCDDVYFITSQELLDLYPTLSAKEREYEITKKHKTVFISKIGDKLSHGEPHDMRAPDYDDWSLDGDLLVYHEVLDMALELSSMGIRVDESSLIQQLIKSHKEERESLPYHQAIIKKELPLTIGGGIGQSRLCMFLLGRGHIGEVQSSYWDKETLQQCEELGIELL
ncbi:MAG: aspartate--ammonia ligase [Clostridia bacterium]|nr:aspartate--ammonia ligase [Clostridia bacterium]